MIRQYGDEYSFPVKIMKVTHTQIYRSVKFFLHPEGFFEGLMGNLHNIHEKFDNQQKISVY